MTAASTPETSSAPGFSRLLTVDEPFPSSLWAQERAQETCRHLEAGHIVFLPASPIEIPVEDRELLLGRKQSSAAYHKNIAYRPLEDRVTGLDSSEAQEGERLRCILHDYSQSSVQFLRTFLAPYAEKWKLEFASYRP